MPPSPIPLRDADPAIDEGLTFARYLDEAAEGFFRILLGRRAPEVIAHAYVRPNNEYSHENVLFAERAGQTAGMALGFTAAKRRGFPANPLRQAEGYPTLRAELIGLLAHPMLRILETVPDGDFYLLSLAVDEDSRGLGVGSALLDAMEGRARATGSRRFSLDVAVKNDGAQRLYARRGLTIESRWPKRLNLGSFGLYRMAKIL